MYNPLTYNKEKQMEANKKWREKNPDKQKAIQHRADKKFYQKHRKMRKASSANYYYEHREEILRKAKEKREKNKLEKCK